MTIRKRLFLSNIMMIVIPALLSVLVLIACLFLFFSMVFPNSGYRLLSQHELEETRQELVDTAQSWLNQTDMHEKTVLADRMAQISEQNRMVLVLRQEQEDVLRFGSELLSADDQLTASLKALNGIGMVSNGTTDLYGEQISAQGSRYQVLIFNPVLSMENSGGKQAALLFGGLVVLLVLVIVFLTNRFLIRFVFQKIASPLQILSQGVRQIRDGNLSYQIVYPNRDEFGPVCEDFNDMARRLRRSVAQSQKEEESRKELLASISHDLRSPLTSIRAYVEGLLDGVADTPQKQKAYLSIIQSKTIEIDQLVKKLFLFSKMDLGEYPYSPEILNPRKEIQDFLCASAEEYRRRGLKVRLGGLPSDGWIQGDPTYFRSILTNLLDNSAKYKEKAQGTVTITGEISGQDFLLFVDDDGPGVPEKALTKLFDVFYRSDPSRKNPNQGSGLGLAIVSKSIQRMGGTIHAENLPAGGLRMALSIPLAEGGEDHETDSDH